MNNEKILDFYSNDLNSEDEHEKKTTENEDLDEKVAISEDEHPQLENSDS